MHNCGNKAVRTGIAVSDFPQEAVAAAMDEITRRISFGMGRKNDEPVDHPVLDAIKTADFAPQRRLYDSAAKQLGTVGAGNHYVDLFAGDDGYVWVGVHFGSRGFGHKTASGFLALAEGKQFGEHAAAGEMDSPPILFSVDSELGQSYLAAMHVHNHHNFAWRERHAGVDVWVVRKGCTPAFPGQEGFVGATMGEDSVILRGVDSDASRDLLYSTVHGAGRVMSRTKAAGRSRRRWACDNRDCDWFQGPGEHKPKDGRCPRCGHGKLSKRMVALAPGVIDWPGVQASLSGLGVELRGGGADEAPDAYKRLDAVLAAHGDTIEVLHLLRPIGVAMAAANTFDPYKD